MDRHTFEKEIWPVRDKLIRVSRYLLDDADGAYDAAQDILIRVWEGRISLNGVQNKEAFLVRSVKNLCLDRLKAAYKVSYPGDDGLPENPEAGMQESPYNDGDAFQKVKKLVESLPEKQKMVMLLRDIEGHDMDEIEYITGMRPVNIRVSLSRARSTVRDALKKAHYHENR